MSDGAADPSTSVDDESVSIHPDYERGNVTLVTDDNTGFRIFDYHLKSRSGVFRTMFDTVPENETIIPIPGVEAEALAFFIKALTEDTLSSLPWRVCQEALRLCDLYDTPSVGETILQAYTSRLNSDTDQCHYEEAFLLASRNSDVESGFNILYNGYRQFDPRTFEVDEVCYCDGFHIPELWSKHFSVQLRIEWLWALLKASNDVRHLRDVTDQHQGKGYWTSLACAFLERMRDK